MKIAIIAPFHEFGGSEHQILLLLRGLLSNNVEVLFCHMDIRSSQLIAALNSMPGCEHTTIRSSGIRNPVAFLRDVLALRALLRSHEIDVAHCWNYSGHIIGGIAAWLAGIPSVFSIGGIDPWKKTWHRPFYRLLNRLPAAFAFQSSTERDIVCKKEWIPIKRTHIIPNAIDRQRFIPGDRLAAKRRLQETLGINPALPLLLSVGSLRRIKGHDILIEAVRLIRRQHQQLEFTLLIAGDGPLRSEYETMAQGLPICFIGFRQDVESLYQAADLYCQPSRSEGLPNAVIEAMACRLPVVASDVGGVRELVSPANGILCSPEDPESLAAALATLLSDRAGWPALASASAHLSERFSDKPMVAAYTSLYRELGASA